MVVARPSRLCLRAHRRDACATRRLCQQTVAAHHPITTKHSIRSIHPAMAKNTGSSAAATAEATRIYSAAEVRGKKPSGDAAMMKKTSIPARVFEELEIVRDPANLFHQTIEQVLIAADLVGLKHHQQIIIAQPKN